ncbi:hypothetical protein GGQ68_002170 [Sagittula marina]|uniref:Uncharacterized protein n=1 Tax=Sagittula marina TaxID=943940 RepID=A0A7W6GSI5_9RHOB|nr:hypothetical protein [Sagittula marina]MBB3985832.1 hypothetical protein [Sagittula marina]
MDRFGRIGNVMEHATQLKLIKWYLSAASKIAAIVVMIERRGDDGALVKMRTNPGNGANPDVYTSGAPLLFRYRKATSEIWKEAA